MNNQTCMNELQAPKSAQAEEKIHTNNTIEEDIIIKCGLEEMRKRFFKDYVIVWHDPNVDSQENKQYIAQLEKFCEVKTFTEWEEASAYLATAKPACYVITSGTNGEVFVKEICSSLSVLEIYTFCGNKEYHLGWTKSSPKVSCVETQIQNILDKIQQNLLEWYQKASSLKRNLPAFAPIFTDWDKSGMNNLHRYLKIIPNFKNRLQAKNDILALSRAIYSNERDRSIIATFEKDYNEYHKEAILRWYTQESFLYKVTNNCLRLASSDSIQYCRLLLKDIERAIKEQYREKSKNFYGLLYRGAYLSEEEWLSLKANLNGEIEMHGFLSASKEKNQALKFVNSGSSSNVFITILVPKGPNEEEQGFAEVEEFSRFPHEKEVLFNVRSRFIVLETEDEYSKQFPYRHLVLLYGAQGFRKYVTDENPVREITFPNIEKTSCFCKNFMNETSTKMFFQSVQDLSGDVYFCKICLPKTKHVPFFCLPASNRGTRRERMKIHGALMKYPVELEFPMFGYKCCKCQAKKREMYYKCTECNDETKTLWCDDCIDDETRCIQAEHVIVLESSPFIFWSERMSENELHHLKFQNEILDWADEFQQGEMFFRSQEYQKAIEYYSIYIQQQRGKKKDGRLAIAYNNIAEAYKSQAKYKTALRYYSKALGVGKLLYGDNNPEVATAYHNIARIYCSQADYEKALEYYSKALEIDRSCYGDDHPEVAASYSNMGQVYHIQAEHKKALEHYSKALNIYVLSGSKSLPNVATCYSNLAQVYNTQAEYKKALEYYSKALETYNLLYGGKHPHVAACYNNVGSIFHILAEYKRSLEYHFQALEIYGHEHPNVAACYSNLGHVYYSQAEYKKALEHYFKALEVYKAYYGEQHPNVATCYSNMALIFNVQFKYEKANEYYSKALEIYISFYGDSHPEVATCYSNTGQVYKSQGDDKKALECFSKALEIYISFYGKNHPHIATCFRNMGQLHNSQAEYKKALKYFAKALEIYEPFYAGSHPHTAICYNNMGFAYLNCADYMMAHEHYSKALEIRKSIYGENHPDVADSLSGIGKVHFFLGERAQALEYYRKSLDMKKLVFHDYHPALASIYCDLGQVLNSLGKHSQALDYYLRSLDIKKQALHGEPPRFSRILFWSWKSAFQFERI